MQGGGVYTPNMPQFGVVPIQGLAGPDQGQVDLASGNSATAYQLAMLQQRQFEADRRAAEKEAQKVALAQKNYFDLQTKLFGPTHNEYQRQEIERIAAEKGVDPDVSADILDNSIAVKELNTNIQATLIDKRVQDLLGQIGVAEKMRASAYNRLTTEEYADWSKEWEAYELSEGPFDVKRLAPSRFQREPEKKQTNFTTDLRNIGTDWATYDPAKPEHRSQVYDGIAQRFSARDEVGAIEQGLIEPDGAGGVRLTDKGKKAVDGEWSRGIAVKTGKLDEWYEKRNYSEALRDQNYQQAEADSDADRAAEIARQKADGSGSGGGGKPTEKDKQVAIDLKAIAGQLNVVIDPNEEITQGKYKGLTVSEAMRKGISDGEKNVAREEIKKHVERKKNPASGKTNSLFFGVPQAGGAQSIYDED